MKVIIKSVSILVNLLVGILGAIGKEGCQSPQYLEVGSKATIICSFQEGFFSVFWYNSRTYTSEQAIVQYKDSVKRGDGITSGEFDIYPNGSLIINNVTLEHDHDFTVIKLDSVLDEYDPHYVRVIVTVRPTYPYPVIEQCRQEGAFCFQKLSIDSVLNCFVTNARPEVSLEWIARTGDTDRNVTFDFSTQLSTDSYSSIASTENPFVYTSGLSLLVCKAKASLGLLEKHESLIIVESTSVDLSTVVPIMKPVRINSRLELKCAESGIRYLVWKYKRNTSGVKYQEILYAVVEQDNLTILKDGFELELGESLVIPSVQIENEGFYGCIYGNGTYDDMTSYDVTVYVPPAPAYPVVEGCDHESYCVLEVTRDGSLTCSVKGIRPKVKLTWKALHDSSSTEISFLNQETTFIRNDDDTYDVSVTSQYEVKDTSTPKVTVECTVIETDIKTLHLNTILNLLFTTGVNKPTGDYIAPTRAAERQGMNTTIIIIVVLIAIIVLVIFTMTCVISIMKGKLCGGRSPVSENDKDVKNPMLPLQVSYNQSAEQDYEAKKQTFKTELKEKYNDLCASIYPVPYMRHKNYTVNQVFVEGGFEYMESSDNWRQLQSHHDILKDSYGKTKRRIVEGNAGYGKSTLALRFAYDWCHTVTESPLRNTEIFILLRLRQLAGVESVYAAIKGLLLPKDTRLSEDDIKNLLQKTSSVVVVLDGFDEYPHEEKDKTSFVISIIKRQIFQQFDVIITTRCGFLPKEVVPQSKIFRLTGFHDAAQEMYLQKIIAEDDSKSTERIKETLQQNPFLDDICRVPIFFALFAHMCNDEKRIQKFSSVTPFFRHIISCLHSHRKNKLQDSDQCAYNDKYESSHSELDMIAFDGLCTNKPLVWEKNILLKKLGEEFYLQYVSIGVLLEEEIFSINDDPGVPMSEHIQRKSEVTFYHKLFCEWYAAHYLAEYVAKPEVKLDPRHEGGMLQGRMDASDKTAVKVDFRYLNPADVQYLYRFACGLRPEAADKIYQYLKSQKGGEKFAILCLLEQTGQFQKIKKTIEKICQSTTTIYGTHGELDQKSTIQHLEIASRQGIPITQLWLTNCFKSVNYTWKQMVLTSGSKIPKLYTLQSLDIRENGREVTKQEAEDILKYCLWCAELKVVRFVYCLMPRTVTTGHLDLLRKRNVKVLWDTDFTYVFKLNLSSGCWQHEDGGVKMTEEEYNEQVEMFRRLKTPRPENDKGKEMQEN